MLILCGAAQAEGQTVSLVMDGTGGPATQHGVRKVAAALQDKNIALERVRSLRAARGNPVIVLDLAGKSRDAVRIHKAFDIPVPT